MKSIYQLCIVFLLLSVFISSCCKCEDKELFDGKYVFGSVIGLAGSNEIGLLEMHDKHEKSYMALYRSEELEASNLGEKYFFKVKTIQGIPMAHSFTTIKPERSNMHLTDPKTKMEYHSLVDHGEIQNIHRRGHYIAGSSQLGTNGNYKLKFREVPGNLPFTLEADLVNKNKVEQYSPGDLFLLHQGILITDVDTCHRHGSRVIECRN